MKEEKKMENISALDYSPNFSALSARERYDFARFLAKHGANFRTSLDRIMYRGFNAWECVGVREIMRECGFIYGVTKLFCGAVGPEGRRELYAKLSEMGMCRNTANRRLCTGSFKEWELTGVNALFNEWKRTCHPERNEGSHKK